MDLILKNWRKYLLKEAYKEERDAFTELIGDPRAFFTMSTVSRLGVYALSEYHTPNGIYCYPLSTKMTIDLIGNNLPYKTRAPLVHVFLVDWDRVLDFGRYTTADLKRDISILQKAYPKEKVSHSSGIVRPFVSLEMAEKLYKKSPFQKSQAKYVPGARLWAMTHDLKKDTNDWARILSRVLGYDGAIDPGYGIIHSNEPNQAVFFPQSRKANIIKVMTFKNGIYYKEYVEARQRAMRRGWEEVKLKGQGGMAKGKEKDKMKKKELERLRGELEGLGKEPPYNIKNIEIPETVAEDFVRLYPHRLRDEKWLLKRKEFQEAGRDMAKELITKDPISFFEHGLHTIKAYQEMTKEAAGQINNPLLFFRHKLHKVEGLEEETEKNATLLAEKEPGTFFIYHLFKIESLREIGKIAVTSLLERGGDVDVFFKYGAHRWDKELSKEIAVRLANKFPRQFFKYVREGGGKEFVTEIFDEESEEFIKLLKIAAKNLANLDIKDFFRYELHKTPALEEMSMDIVKELLESEGWKRFFVYKLHTLEDYQEIAKPRVKKLASSDPKGFFVYNLFKVETYQEFNKIALRNMFEAKLAPMEGGEWGEGRHRERRHDVIEFFFRYKLDGEGDLREIARPFINFAVRDDWKFARIFLTEGPKWGGISWAATQSGGGRGGVEFFPEEVMIAAKSMAEHYPDDFFRYHISDLLKDMGLYKPGEDPATMLAITKHAQSRDPYLLFTYNPYSEEYPKMHRALLKQIAAENPWKFLQKTQGKLWVKGGNRNLDKKFKEYRIMHSDLVEIAVKALAEKEPTVFLAYEAWRTEYPESETIALEREKETLLNASPRAFFMAHSASPVATAKSISMRLRDHPELAKAKAEELARNSPREYLEDFYVLHGKFPLTGYPGSIPSFMKAFPNEPSPRNGIHAAGAPFVHIAVAKLAEIDPVFFFEKNYNLGFKNIAMLAATRIAKEDPDRFVKLGLHNVPEYKSLLGDPKLNENRRSRKIIIKRRVRGRK